MFYYSTDSNNKVIGYTTSYQIAINKGYKLKSTTCPIETSSNVIGKRVDSLESNVDEIGYAMLDLMFS